MQCIPFFLSWFWMQTSTEALHYVCCMVPLPMPLEGVRGQCVGGVCGTQSTDNWICGYGICGYGVPLHPVSPVPSVHQKDYPLFPLQCPPFNEGSSVTKFPPCNALKFVCKTFCSNTEDTSQQMKTHIWDKKSGNMNVAIAILYKAAHTDHYSWSCIIQHRLKASMRIMLNKRFHLWKGPKGLTRKVLGETWNCHHPYLFYLSSCNR